MNFSEKLEKTIKQKNSILCIGLDPVFDSLPQSLKKSDNPILEFNKRIISVTAEYAAAFKINLAFYEALGLQGWKILEQTMKYLPNDVIKIADVKRGDIGNTAKMYSKALFENLGADAITINPLMGYDSAEPFLYDENRGVFFLCLTSNPGSRDFQYFSDGKMKLYEKIAQTVLTWNDKNNCGLVVGATHPSELASIREMCPNLPLLIPGIGAQGGDIITSVKFGTNVDGSMALFNSSRGIIYSSNKNDFDIAAKESARLLKEQLNRAREKKHL